MAGIIKIVVMTNTDGIRRVGSLYQTNTENGGDAHDVYDVFTMAMTTTRAGIS